MGWERDLRKLVETHQVLLIEQTLAIEEVKLALPKKRRWNRGENPFHYACRKGLVNIIQILLNAGADPNSVSVDGTGHTMTCLHWSVYYNQIEATKILLEHGADCLIPGKCLSYEGSSIEIAKQIGRNQIKDLITQNCNTVPRDSRVGKPSILEPERTPNAAFKAHLTIQDKMVERERIARHLAALDMEIAELSQDLDVLHGQ